MYEIEVDQLAAAKDENMIQDVYSIYTASFFFLLPSS